MQHHWIHSLVVVMQIPSESVALEVQISRFFEDELNLKVQLVKHICCPWQTWEWFQGHMGNHTAGRQVWPQCNNIRNTTFHLGLVCRAAMTNITKNSHCGVL